MPAATYRARSRSMQRPGPTYGRVDAAAEPVVAEAYMMQPRQHVVYGLLARREARGDAPPAAHGAEATRAPRRRRPPPRASQSFRRRCSQGSPPSLCMVSVPASSAAPGPSSVKPILCLAHIAMILASLAPCRGAACARRGGPRASRGGPPRGSAPAEAREIICICLPVCFYVHICVCLSIYIHIYIYIYD